MTTPLNDLIFSAGPSKPECWEMTFSIECGLGCLDPQTRTRYVVLGLTIDELFIGVGGLVASISDQDRPHHLCDVKITTHAGPTPMRLGQNVRFIVVSVS